MTYKERKYLRSAFHHFDDRTVKHTNTPDTKELAREWHDYKCLMKILFHVLCLNGDEDNEVEMHIKDIFEEHKIKELKK